MRTLHRTLVTLCLVLAANVALAEGVVIGSGAKGGYYHAIARGLRVVLYSEHGIPTDVLATRGSMENLGQLADPESLVNIALAQADALQSYLASNPGFAGQYVQVSDAGKECAFIVSSTKGSIEALADLAGDASRTIAVGEAGSGAAVTWSNMTRLRPGLARTGAVNQGIIEALLDLRTADPNKGLAAAMMVQRPMAVATPLEIVLQNREDYRLVPIREADLQEPDRDGDTSGYRFEKVVVGFGRDYQMSVDTICTRGLVLAAKDKLTTEELDAVAKAVMSSRRYIMPGGR